MFTNSEASRILSQRSDNIVVQCKDAFEPGRLTWRGGRHISGAERIVPEDGLEEQVIAMLRRARTHERGRADFIQVKVEEIKEKDIMTCP